MAMDIKQKYKIWAWISWALMIAGALTACIGGFASAPKWVIILGAVVMLVGIISWIARTIFYNEKNISNL